MMVGEEEFNLEDLPSDLSAYKEHLRQVRQRLDKDPNNSEDADMEKQLIEVIFLTEELLATTNKNDISGSDICTGTNASSHSFSESEELYERFSVGTKIQAVWSDDGEWYDATIVAHSPNGYFVCFDGWGNKEEVDIANVRAIETNALMEAERAAEATKQSIRQKLAHAASFDFQSRTLPAKLRIEPNDPDDVRAAKRKKIHAFKSKIRSEQLEMAQNKRQNAWQQFQTTKGRTKKIGFFSGRKRESIFKSPDDPHGKVGVTGSGKGLTEFQKREKHLHLKAGGLETDE